VPLAFSLEVAVTSTEDPWKPTVLDAVPAGCAARKRALLGLRRSSSSSEELGGGEASAPEATRPSHLRGLRANTTLTPEEALTVTVAGVTISPAPVAEAGSWKIYVAGVGDSRELSYNASRWQVRLRTAASGVRGCQVLSVRVWPN